MRSIDPVRIESRMRVRVRRNDRGMIKARARARVFAAWGVRGKSIDVSDAGATVLVNRPG